ncbi:MAG: triose-phosphate isomerase family protein [bacterium]|nr:triose-phosphate isomerase family protein [bacterium]
MNKLIVLNHKMAFSYDDLYKYISELNDINKSFVVLPSYTYLKEFCMLCNYPIGSQNVSKFMDNNHTSQISALQLKNIGVNYALIGHSECRKEFNETNIDIKQKVVKCLENNIIPIICVGEKKGEDVIFVIEEQLNLIKDIDSSNIVVVYEPVWAIGTGEFPLMKEIDTVIKYIRNSFKKSIKVLYGGSVNKDNIADILMITDGILVGSKSANISFVKDLVKEIE